MAYEFEQGVVNYSAEDGEFIARLNDGSVINYGSPETTQANKLFQSIDAVRTGRPLACGIDSALPHLACVAAAQQAPVHPFPGALVKIQDDGGDQLTYVEGLAETLAACYENWSLPSETGAGWAVLPAHVQI
jgi:hypothetical protein